MSESETPRTDAAMYAVFEFKGNGTAYVDHHAVPRDFARQLERELAEARRDAELWCAASTSTIVLWDGVEMKDIIAAWENEYRARLARGLVTDKEVKKYKALVKASIDAAIASDPPAAEKG